jgi:hypothetical protein
MPVRRFGAISAEITIDHYIAWLPAVPAAIAEASDRNDQPQKQKFIMDLFQSMRWGSMALSATS